MKPVTPIIPGSNMPETVYAKNQHAYNPLPVWKSRDGRLLSRWKLSWGERLQVIFTGNVYLWIWTFNYPLQPVRLQVNKPQVTNVLCE